MTDKRIQDFDRITVESTLGDACRIEREDWLSNRHGEYRE